MKNNKVLLVEDNPDDCDAVIRTLNQVDAVAYSCEQAQDGPQGLNMLASYNPDCVLLDYSLPGQNGLEILQRMQQDYPFLPVILLTGQGNEGIAVEAIKAGAQNYLTKSKLSPERLHVAINSAIEHCALTVRVGAQDREIMDREARMSAILDHTVDGLITIDENGIVQTYNKACKVIFGYRPEEVIGQNIKMLMPDHYAGQHDRYLENYRNTNRTKIIGSERETQARHKDGTVFPVDLSVSEVPQEGGKRLFSGIIRDITERKKTEEALINSNLELQRFAYIASHDLQEPIRMITSFSQLLRDQCSDQLDERATKYLGFISDGAERMQLLVTDLLEYSRIENETAAFKDTDCNETVQSVLQTLEESIRESQAQVIVDKLPVISSHPVRLARLFQNLVGNAIKYRAPGRSPKIRISAVEEEEQWLFSVADNGIGIKQEYLEQIFIIFKRLHNKSQYPGTGIGLAVCKRIVQSFGGRIWAQSQVGKGSTFYFSISKQAPRERVDE